MMREKSGAEASGFRPSHRDPVADEAIGHIVAEEKKKKRGRPRKYRLPEEPCCLNCTYYFFKDESRVPENGCKNIDRIGYQQNPEMQICSDWKACDPSDGRIAFLERRLR